MKHRCTVTSQDYCNSPPANQEVDLPWGPVELSSESDSEVDDGFIIRTPPHYYDDDEEAIASSPAHEDDDDDKDFTFSPASPPPLTRVSQRGDRVSVSGRRLVHGHSDQHLQPDDRSRRF